MRETTDCINGMEAENDESSASESFPTTMEHIQQELPSRVTSEEKPGMCSDYRPVENFSLDDDLSDTVTYDCLGVVDDESDRYERLHLEGATAGCHIYKQHIRVMRDILAEIPPGMTADDVLRTCADDRPTANESDDEDPEENSDYMKGIIPDIMENEENCTTSNEIHDANKKPYEHPQPVTADENTYTGHNSRTHIPPMMPDISVEMSPGITADDILSGCADDQQTQNDSDDEDPEETSDKI